MTKKFDKQYRVKLHIKFTHDDERTESIHATHRYYIHKKDPSHVEKLVLDQYENSDTPLTEYPDDWYGNRSNEELVIDEITYMGTDKSPQPRHDITSFEKEMVDLESYIDSRDIEFSIVRHPTGWNINIPLPDTNKDD